MVGSNPTSFASDSFGISNIRACCREEAKKNTDIDQLDEEMVLEAFFNAVDVKPCQWMAGSNPILFASGSFGISSSSDLWPEKIPRLLCLPWKDSTFILLSSCLSCFWTSSLKLEAWMSWWPINCRGGRLRCNVDRLMPQNVVCLHLPWNIPRVYKTVVEAVYCNELGEDAWNFSWRNGGLSERGSNSISAQNFILYLIERRKLNL